MKTPTLDDLDDQLAHAAARGDWFEAEGIGAQADRLAAQREAALTCHGAALWYASIGLHVFPLQPGLKVPFRGSRGCKDASIDADQINRWWQANPHANVAIATGYGVDVIDIDGAKGIRSWLESHFPPILGRVSTPRPGGHHLYVAATGYGNQASPGIDFRGLGGYVVGAPSWLDERPGQPYSGRYRWIQPLDLTHQADAAVTP